ncbi:asparagine-linked glycosylation protein, partial [Coemansia sp. RSA 552]
MLSLESAIHYALVIGLVLALPLVTTMAVQFFTLGTQSHQTQCRQRVRQATRPDTSTHEPYYVGFFHPYPNAGGGGERVLWTMIRAIQEKYPFIVSVIYSGDRVERDSLVRNVQSKFGLVIDPERIHVEELTWRWWIDYKSPRFTILVQSLGSVALAAQAIRRFCPDVFVDTVGFAFTYPFVTMLSSRIPIVAYTHYPTISSDMQSMVSSRESGVNNDERIARSASLTALKAAYYQSFATLYAFAGSFAWTIMTNSSWTHGHIVQLFEKARMTHVVYPPCDSDALAKFPLTPSSRIPAIVSLAQFRPEKNHVLQIEAFARLLKNHPEYAAPADQDPLPPPAQLLAKLEAPGASPPQYPLLVIIGGARNKQDRARAEALRQRAKALGIDSQVLVVVNAPWSQVLKWLQISSLGLHTMRDEHFGISVVEMMAAGLLTIAHDSAGPRLDIVTPAIRCNSAGSIDAPTDARAKAYLKRGDAAANRADQFPVGMVATTADEFAQMLRFGLAASPVVKEAVRKAARSAATARFSEAAFSTSFYKHFSPV